MALYEQTSLYILKDKLVFTPPSNKTHNETEPKVLVINRRDGSISISDPSSVGSLRSAKKKTVHGILGMLATPNRSQMFLVVIVSKVHIGTVCGHVVWRAETTEIIDVKSRSETKEANDSTARSLKQLLINLLAMPYFYFSYTGDISQTQQRLFTMSGDELYKNLPAVKKADSRFLWNGFLLSPFLAPQGSGGESPILRFVVPVICGAVFIKKCSINGNNFTWSVISRRSRYRVGARLWLRGCDDKGKVANFVETEQIVEGQKSGALSSFVQTRGSMPMFWQQRPDLRYKPPPKMERSFDSLAGFLGHFKEQLPLYGEQVIVNLVNQTGSEGELEINLRNLVREANLSAVHYVGYDFHAECKKSSWKVALNNLIDKLTSFVDEFEYFFIAGNDPVTLKRQKGVFRTNCIDCLDRTNVIQSMLATENLKIVLKRMGILSPSDNLLSQTSFSEIYRNVWADNADMISVQYAGTGALKTDFTRTGKRTKKGLLQDGWNALNRYYINNFLDGDRTDAMRVFVNECDVEKFLRAELLAKSNNSHHRTLSYLPKVWLLFLVVLLTTLIAYQPDKQFFALSILSLVFIALITKMIMKNGFFFVNKPVSFDS